MVSFIDWAAARLVVIVAVVGAAGVTGGTLLGVFVISNDGNPPAEQPADGPEGTEPTPLAATPETGTPTGGGFPGAPTRINEFGVPVGYPRTEAGAVSACGNYVAAYSDVRNREPTRIENLFRSIGIDSTYAALAEEIVEADRTTAENFSVPSINSPEMGFNIRTVGYSVESYSSDEATVAVWSTSSVGVYDGAERVKPRESWGTDNCTVQWIDADWRLAQAGDGPESPVLTERGSEAFQRFILLGAAS